MKNINILITDDEISQVEILAGFLRKKGYNIYTSGNVEQGIDIVKNRAVDIVISDFKMPDKNGLEFLEEVKSINPDIDFIILTAFGNLNNAVRAMQLGAYDYLTKPIALEELEIKLLRLEEKKNLKSENRILKEHFRENSSFSSIISKSEQMEEVISLAVRAANSKTTVLISGESGTGKEILAKAIHLLSSRKDMPFVAINIPALAETLLESELFGHEKGSFTGAEKLRKGRFELAHNGTLFLDEIGDVPMSIQVKLLRVLQEQKIERIGGSEQIVTDVRIIAATNKDLEKLVQEEKFRLDLFYRLNVIRINIPPLRDRRADIQPLIDFYLNKFSKENGKGKIEISKEALALLMKYNFPGNIRELVNIIERGVVLCRDGIITTNDLPPQVSGFVSDGIITYDLSIPLNEQIETLEKILIKKALEKTDGHQTNAGKLLGLSERNLRYKMSKYGL